MPAICRPTFPDPPPPSLVLLTECRQTGRVARPPHPRCIPIYVARCAPLRDAKLKMFPPARPTHVTPCLRP